MTRTVLSVDNTVRYHKFDKATSVFVFCQQTALQVTLQSIELSSLKSLILSFLQSSTFYF